MYGENPIFATPLKVIHMNTGDLVKAPTGLEILRANAERKRIIRHNRASAMEKYIRSEAWDWFITITSKHHLTEASARRVAQQYVRLIQLSGSVDFRQGSDNHRIDVAKGNNGLCMWVAEPHKHSQSGYHLHLLLRLPYRYKDLSNKKQFRFLLDKARLSVGGSEWLNAKGISGLWHRCQLEPYRGDKASEYCAKYVTKDFADYDFSRIL